ncbi:MAG: hypothetical protein IJF29_01980 [Firmicutes bacterium]|nr:hypothetical protein [Bacillota bacterium]
MKEKEGIKDIFNAAVPFMPEDKRRQMFIFTKLMEIMDYKEDMAVFENVNEDKKKRRDRFLKSVSPFVTEEEKNDIDMLVKIIELKRIMG